MNFSSINSKPNDSSNYSAYSENFVIYEAFNDRGYKEVGTTGNTILSGQVLPLSLIATDYSNKLKTVNQNYYDLSSNISTIKSIQNDISGNTLYDYNTPFILEKPVKNVARSAILRTASTPSPFTLFSGVLSFHVFHSFNAFDNLAP